MTTRTLVGLAAALFAPGLLLLTGCGDDGSRPPTTGTLEVEIVTSGDAPDPDGYTLFVADAIHITMIDETLTFEELDEGPYDVELTDVEPNCSVMGENPRSVTVVAGETTRTTFDVSCPAPASGAQSRS